MFKKPDKWNIVVVGNLSFKDKHRITYCESLTIAIDFDAVLTKGDRVIKLNNFKVYRELDSYEYSSDADAFYDRAMKILKNKNGELDMAINKAIIESIRSHFKKENTKSNKEQFQELIKEPMSISVNLQVKDSKIFE